MEKIKLTSFVDPTPPDNPFEMSRCCGRDVRLDYRQDEQVRDPCAA
jgi:hypothetical protein